MSDAAARAALTGLVALAVLVALGLMLKGWRGRAERQAELPVPSDAPLPGGAAPPAEGPAAAAPVRLGPLPGRYLATTTSGSWLDRVVVHGLGAPSRAELTVRDDGVLLTRTGARDLFVPREDLADAHLDRGIAGAVYEDGGLVVLTWRLGDQLLDTGFRADQPDRHAEVVGSVVGLGYAHPSPGDAA